MQSLIWSILKLFLCVLLLGLGTYQTIIKYDIARWQVCDIIPQQLTADRITTLYTLISRMIT